MSERPLRITFVLPCYPRLPVGGFRVVYEHANRLAAKGHRVSLLHARGLPERGPVPRGVPLGRFRRFAADLRDLVSKPRVRWMKVDERVEMLYAPDASERHVPDGEIIVATAWQTAAPVAGYDWRKGVGHYLVQHVEHFLPHGEDPERIARRVEATWRLPLRITAVSRWIAEKIASSGVRADVAVVPPGIDASRFRPFRPLDARPETVAMMYSSAPFKGGQDGIAALRVARSRRPALRAVLFGTEAPPRGLDPWIEYRRSLSEKPLVTLYNDSRVFLCSSLAEGFALPPAEAMACGCAVVSTDCGGNLEYAEHGKTALLSPPRDPGALAANLTALLNDDRLRRALAEEGLRRIAAFDWETSAARLEKRFLDSIEPGA